MDYLQMTAPCGLDCFNCVFFLANENEEAMAELIKINRLMDIPVEMMLCQGCRNQKGLIKLHANISTRSEDQPCPAYGCSGERGFDFCYECGDFPCDHLHPYSDRADKVPHNTKVFNLCLIKKMGLEKWAQHKAAKVRETYFGKWWSL